MQFIFMDMAGRTLFIRDDAERAEWTTEEMSLDMEFPYLEDKIITIGSRVFFTDPGTGEHQVYEIKQVKTQEPEHFQTVVAENIVISELTDLHIDTLTETDKTITDVLSDLLEHTEWKTGIVSSNPTSTCEFSRGSVWNAITSAKANWNVYITPRVVVTPPTSSGSSSVTNLTIQRYLDVTNPEGVWRGVRLSVNKNLLDPAVIYDDSGVCTALYGYGGTVSTTDEDEEVTFENVVWEATDTHPPKPAGVKFLDDPKATAKFGRDGQPRFGYYQNSDIKDAETLLEKTWEMLTTCNTPDISIEGTVADLYRMGYADQPLRLHDLAIVDVEPDGFSKQIQIIRMTVDLLDPSSTQVTIGSYIPNIIYINKETNESATGGGAGNNKKTDESSWKEFRTTIESFKDGTGLRIKAVQNDINNTKEEVAQQSGRIDVAYNKIEMEVEDRRREDGVLSSKITITASQIRQEVSNSISGLDSKIIQTASQIRSEVTNAVSGLQSSITQTANEIRAEVSNSESRLNSKITQTASQIRSEVTNAVSGLQSSITQTASQIRSEVSNSISGLSSSITQTASQIRSEVTNAVSGLSSRITQEANRISLVVEGTGADAKIKTASIVAGINDQSGSYVQISADKINLTGYVTASQLDVTDAKITNLTSGAAVANTLKTLLLSASTGFTYQGHSVSFKTVTINGTTYYLMGYS